MIKFIDDQLNRITMYRLVLYYLIILYSIALYLCWSNIIAFDPFSLLLSLAILLGVSWITNRLFSWTFRVPANVESIYISVMILGLIITPPKTSNDIWFLIWAAILAMASKYIIAYKGKHLFNPVAFAVALTYFAINQSASWWIGSGVMLPFVILGGLLVVRKIGRFDLVLSFLITSFCFNLISTLFNGNGLFSTLQNIVLSSPILFFAFIILTEPMTTPPTRKLRIYYGVLAGILFTPQLHIGSFYITPEVAILSGNIYSFIVSPKERLILKLKERTRIAPDTFEFVFASPQKFNFKPGQYMEWTLGYNDSDSRGNRRYFTLASAPTENNLKLGIRFYQKSSTFKRTMLSMGKGSEILASQLEGDFVLPNDVRQKCVFIAGGIGITPFRSMIKYLLDTHQRRPITLFYAVRSVNELVYKDIFDRAEKELGIKIIYTLTESSNIPAAWSGRTGRITPEMIRSFAPNYRTSIFYISGSRGMVDTFKETLHRLRMRDSQIKTDFFAGLA